MQSNVIEAMRCRGMARVLGCTGFFEDKHHLVTDDFTTANYCTFALLSWMQVCPRVLVSSGVLRCPQLSSCRMQWKVTQQNDAAEFYDHLVDTVQASETSLPRSTPAAHPWTRGFILSTRGVQTFSFFMFRVSFFFGRTGCPRASL